MRNALFESRSLGMEREVGGKLRPKFDDCLRPIANKYHEGQKQKGCEKRATSAHSHSLRHPVLSSLAPIRPPISHDAVVRSPSNLRRRSGLRLSPLDHQRDAVCDLLSSIRFTKRRGFDACVAQLVVFVISVGLQHVRRYAVETSVRFLI